MLVLEKPSTLGIRSKWRIMRNSARITHVRYNFLKVIYALFIKTCCFIFFIFPSIYAEEEKSHEITIEIKINCPMSEELNQFVKSIPENGDYSVGFCEWKSSFITNMTQLIHLVESEKIHNSSWSVKTDNRLRQQVQDD